MHVFVGIPPPTRLPKFIKSMAFHPHGLYALTPDDCPSLADAVEATIAGGARMIQYRDKTANTMEREARAKALLALCRPQGIPLIINDDLDLALALGADGVHLGEDDCSIAKARERLPGGLIGASCYNDFARAQAAIRSGASYVAFGSFYASPTRPDAVTAQPDLLMRARRELSVPVCAIGGINADNAAPLIQAGANLLAVCSGIFAQPDIASATRAITRQFQKNG